MVNIGYSRVRIFWRAVTKYWAGNTLLLASLLCAVDWIRASQAAVRQMVYWKLLSLEKNNDRQHSCKISKTNISLFVHTLNALFGNWETNVISP